MESLKKTHGASSLDLNFRRRKKVAAAFSVREIFRRVLRVR